MKKFISTLLLSASLCSPIFAQEMPADLTEKLEAEAAKLHPEKAKEAKSWMKKQVSAWETLQNLSLGISDEDAKMITELAKKQFPLDFVKQETFINEQAALTHEIVEFKSQLGKATYDSMMADFKKSDKLDLKILLKSMQTALDAKMEMDNITSEQIDPEMLAILKEVMAKRYPSDAAAQIEMLKKFVKAMDALPADMVAAKDNSDETKQRQLSMSEMDKLVKDLFSVQTFTTEGENKSIALVTEMQGKRVIILPFAAYSPGLSLTNNLGEQVEFNQDQVYVSKTHSLILIFPKNLPEKTKNAVFIADKQYRDIVDKTVFLLGFNRNEIQSFPIKISGINENEVLPSRKIPANYCDGAIMVNPHELTTVSMLLRVPPKIRNANWTSRSEVTRLVRDLDPSFNVLFDCIRLDKIDKWEKLNVDKFYEQKAKVDHLRMVVNDVVGLFASSRLSESENKQIVGPIVKKYTKEFKSRMDKARFERQYKSFMQDVSNLIRSELRETKNTDFYTLYQADVANYVNVLEQIQKTYENAGKNQSYLMLLQDDVKQAQSL